MMELPLGSHFSATLTIDLSIRVRGVVRYMRTFMEKGLIYPFLVLVEEREV